MRVINLKIEFIELISRRDRGHVLACQNARVIVRNALATIIGPSVANTRR